MRLPKIIWFRQVLDIKKGGNSLQETEKESLWKDRRDWRPFIDRSTQNRNNTTREDRIYDFWDVSTKSCSLCSQVPYS